MNTGGLAVGAIEIDISLPSIVALNSVTWLVPGLWESYTSSNVVQLAGSALDGSVKGSYVNIATLHISAQAAGTVTINPMIQTLTAFSFNKTIIGNTQPRASIAASHSVAITKGSNSGRRDVETGTPGASVHRDRRSGCGTAGDVNFDCVVDAHDVTSLIILLEQQTIGYLSTAGQSLKRDPRLGAYLTVADVDGDGLITYTDANFLLDFDMELTAFPTLSFTPVEQSSDCQAHVTVSLSTSTGSAVPIGKALVSVLLLSTSSGITANFNKGGVTQGTIVQVYNNVTGLYGALVSLTEHVASTGHLVFSAAYPSSFTGVVGVIPIVTIKSVGNSRAFASRVGQGLYSQLNVNVPQTTNTLLLSNFTSIAKFQTTESTSSCILLLPTTQTTQQVTTTFTTSFPGIQTSASQAASLTALAIALPLALFVAIIVLVIVTRSRRQGKSTVAPSVNVSMAHLMCRWKYSSS